MILALYLLLGLGALCCCSVVVYRVYFHPLAKVPGPFLAKLTDLYGGYHAWTRKNHYHLYDLHKKYGTAVRYGPNRVSFNSSFAISEIYGAMRPFKKSIGYRAMLPGNGLPNTFSIIEKAHHSKRRRIFAYGFSETALKGYESVVQSYINKFGSVLTKGADSEGWGPVQNMSRTCSGLALDLLGELAFSEPFGVLEDTSLEYLFEAIVSAGRSMGTLIHLPMFGRSNLLFNMRWLFQLLILPLKDVRNVQNYLKIVAATAKRRKEREDSGVDIKSENGRNKDIFHYILHARDPVTNEPFTPEELSAEARACIFAGTDTTSSTLAAAFYWLTSSPISLGKLRCELNSVFQSEDEICLGPKLNACSYLRNVVEEVLRISGPVGGILWREATENHVVEGYTIPKGAEAGIAIFAIHHNPKYFHNPHVFDPDRWDDSIVGVDSAAAARSAWIPFLTGPRSCIGRSLALMELHLILAKIIFRYEMKVDESRRTAVQVIVEGLPEFETKDQLAAETIGPFLQFRRIKQTTSENNLTWKLL